MRGAAPQRAAAGGRLRDGLRGHPAALHGTAGGRAAARGSWRLLGCVVCRPAQVGARCEAGLAGCGTCHSASASAAADSA